MRTAVFGAGALGSLLGGLLAQKHPVTLIGRPDHVRAIRASGLRIVGQGTTVAKVEAAETAEGLPPVELLLLTVKSYDTQAATEGLRPLVGPGTILVSVQNGLGNWELLRSAYPARLVLAATVTWGAVLREPGVVEWNGSGDIVIGGSEKDAHAAARVVEAFQAAKVSAHATRNIEGALWLKAIVNAAINPLTVLHRCPNGRLLEDPVLRAAMRKLVEEAVQVTAAKKIDLGVKDVVAHVESVAKVTAANRSSMLQSFERGRPLELDAITGRILEAARVAAITCPTHAEMYRRVHALALQR